ncbi:LRR domain containing protein, partial [Trema orientale]
NLQILNFLYSPIFKLPIEIYKLRNLRHLLGLYHDRTSGHNLDAIYGIRTPKGIGGLENLHMVSVVDANYGGADLIKELEKLRQLRWLGIVKLTTETGRVLCASIQTMNHLERMDLVASSMEEIIDLYSISSPPPLLRRLVLRCR